MEDGRRSGDVHFSSDRGCRRPPSGTGWLAQHLMPIGLCPSFVRRAGVAFHRGSVGRRQWAIGSYTLGVGAAHIRGMVAFMRI